MNGIEKITERIENEALAEAAVILAQGDEECKVLKAEYDKLAQDEYWKLVRQGVKECEQRVTRLASTAEMEAKKSVLSMKQEMVGLAFDRALEMLTGLPEDKYTEFLAKQAANASATGLEELIFNQKDKALVSKNVCKMANELLSKKGLYGKLTVSEETRNILGGVIVRQGNIEANCSIEILVELCRGELASQAAELMFE